VFELLGKNFGVAGGFEDLLRDLPGYLVLSVSVRDSTDEGRYDDLRTFAPHREHGIVEHAVVSPARKGLFLSLRESEVGLSAPQLVGAVVFVGFEKLVGADDTESIVAVSGHSILSALAARER